MPKTKPVEEVAENVEAPEAEPKEPRAVKPFEFCVMHKDGSDNLLKCGDLIEFVDENLIVFDLDYSKQGGQYKFIDIDGKTLELYPNKEKGEWQLCIHDGNEFDPETGVPVVKRVVHDSFPMADEELSNI